MLRTKHDEKGGDILITRIFDASRELVWNACTDPELAKRWWGPKGFTAPVITIDLREGGRYLYDMRSPDGRDFWSTGVIREIIPMEKIVYTDHFADAEGNIVPPSRYGMTGDWPEELLVTMTFEDLNGKTKFTLVHQGIPPGEMAEDATAGWNESFDKLERVIAEEKARLDKIEIVARPGTQVAKLTRTFEAPPERLFRALTDELLVPLWWGPARYTTIVETMDPRPGGTWRIVQIDEDGNEFVFHGVYHQVSPTRIVQTSEWEGMPGHVQLEIAMLEDLGERTKLTETSLAESIEDARGMIESGMLEGWRETVDRLARLVETNWEAQPTPGPREKKRVRSRKRAKGTGKKIAGVAA